MIWGVLDSPLTPTLSDSAERLDLSLFGRLKALSLSKGSSTSLVAGRGEERGPSGTARVWNYYLWYLI